MDEDFEYEQPGAKRGPAATQQQAGAIRARFGLRQPGHANAAALASTASESQVRRRCTRMGTFRNTCHMYARCTCLSALLHCCLFLPTALRLRLSEGFRDADRFCTLCCSPARAFQVPYPVGEGGMRLAGLPGHLKEIEVGLQSLLVTASTAGKAHRGLSCQLCTSAVVQVPRVGPLVNLYASTAPPTRLSVVHPDS